jgi:hypothetical protein
LEKAVKSPLFPLNLRLLSQKLKFWESLKGYFKLMRKPVFPRALGLLVLYGAVFVVLGMLQFTKQGNFTQRIGAATVSGQYRSPEEGGAGLNPNEHPVTGGVSVFFGGLEFRMKTGEGGDGFALIDGKGARYPVVPELMTVLEDTANFLLPGGTELIFATQYADGKPGLRISGSFAGDISGAEIPFQLLRSSRIRESGDGQFAVITGGISYTFGRSAGGESREVLSLKAEGLPVFYGAVPEKKAFTPDDFILPQAFTRMAYQDYVTRWLDRNFSLWNRIIAGQNDEDMVIAYGGDAVKRGNYKAAVAAVSPAFLTGSGRTYESSVYLGGMNQALRSLTNGEREKTGRLSRQFDEKSPDFLRENHVFEFLAVRGFVNFIDNGVELIHSMDPANLTPELIPGVFEGCLDLKHYRPHGDNPFDRLIDQSCYIISEGARRFKEIRRLDTQESAPSAGDWVLVFQGAAADMEFNLRLGKALWMWAESSNRGEWAALGRSLVVSVLSLADGTGTTPVRLLLSGDGRITEDQGPRISSARLYRVLNAGEYYPRAAVIGSGVNGIWAWTAASAVTAAQENNILDISVSFPAGETHYMLIRGIRPFTKLQLYNIDYRTDPQFERYDSSGWVYSAQDQVLLLKMKHRNTVEHIQIFY